MDDELKGEGNHYTTEFRQLDPRLGRWFSVDPRAAEQPWITPYSSMNNNPIMLTDVLGDKPGDGGKKSKNNLRKFRRARKHAARIEKRNNLEQGSVTYGWNEAKAEYWFHWVSSHSTNVNEIRSRYIFPTDEPSGWHDDLYEATIKMGSDARSMSWLNYHGTNLLNGTQFALDAAGLFPVAGFIPDLINAGISKLRGNNFEATMSLGAALPGVGLAVGSTKIGVKLTSKVSKGLKLKSSTKAGSEVIEDGVGMFRKKNLHRGKQNIGEFKDLKVPMNLRTVQEVAEKGGVGLKGIKIKIIRDKDLIGKNLFGYVHPKGNRIDLYPDAFMNYDELVKTLGHERTHVYQMQIFGKTTNTSDLLINERAAYEIEDTFSQFYNWNK